MAKTVKKGFVESISQYETIMQQLKKNGCHGSYLLMGSEPYFINKISDYISNNAIEEQYKSFNQHIVYGSEISSMDLVDLCHQYPMGASKTVVIVREAAAIKSPEYLKHYFNNPSESTILVLCYKDSMDKRSALYKAIEKNSVIFESVEPRDYEIQGWLTNFIRSKGYNIEPSSVELLVESLGTSITKIENEIDKLLTAIPESQKAITAGDIEENIGISKDFNNFELTKALSNFDIAKALMIVDYFGKNPQKNNYSATISTLFNHFVKIFKLGIIEWEQKKRQSAKLSDQELASKLQIGSAFFLKEYNMALRHFPLSKIHSILGFIRTYEMRGKGVETGSAEEGDLLKELICKIISI